MKADLLAGLSLEFLLQVLGEAYESGGANPDVESAFVYRHARNVSELGRDVALLYSHQQYTAASVAIRSMLESMFCVVASAKTKGFAVEKLIAESENMSSRIRVTTSTPTQRGHVQEKIGFSGEKEPNDYDRNIQVADLNAMNAILAVIRWKKLCGFYHDQTGEHSCIYAITGNMLINEDKT